MSDYSQIADLAARQRLQEEFVSNTIPRGLEVFTQVGVNDATGSDLGFGNGLYIPGTEGELPLPVN
jgi:hypothetical protein